MKKENILHQLLNSLQPYPNMRFLLFTDRLDSLERVLFKYCEDEGHEIQIYNMSNSEFNIESKNIKIRPFNPAQPRYNLHGRLYDYCFVHKRPEDTDSFLSRVYSAIANAGRIYITMDIDNKNEIYALQTLLEEKNFVSISQIELDEKELYVSAKKMHGWGS